MYPVRSSDVLTVVNMRAYFSLFVYFLLIIHLFRINGTKRGSTRTTKMHLFTEYPVRRTPRASVDPELVREIQDKFILFMCVFSYLAICLFYLNMKTLVSAVQRNDDPKSVLFCSLAVLDPSVGHTKDVLSQFIRVFCHSD